MGIVQQQAALSIEAIAQRIGSDAVQILLLQAQVSAQAATIADRDAKLAALEPDPEPSPEAAPAEPTVS
jgi:hypothetical protein